MKDTTETTFPPDDDKAIVLEALKSGLGTNPHRSLVFDALNRLAIGAWRYEQLKEANDKFAQQLSEIPSDDQ